MPVRTAMCQCSHTVSCHSDVQYHFWMWTHLLSTVKSQIFVRYLFSYFWLDTGSHERIFVLLRASKQNDIDIQVPQNKKKFSYSVKFSSCFQKYESTKISTERKFVTLQYCKISVGEVIDDVALNLLDYQCLRSLPQQRHSWSVSRSASTHLINTSAQVLFVIQMTSCCHRFLFLAFTRPVVLIITFCFSFFCFKRKKHSVRKRNIWEKKGYMGVWTRCKCKRMQNELIELFCLFSAMAFDTAQDPACSSKALISVPTSLPV